MLWSENKIKRMLPIAIVKLFSSLVIYNCHCLVKNEKDKRREKNKPKQIGTANSVIKRLQETSEFLRASPQSSIL